MPPDEVPTTIEELPAGFWDDGPTAAAIASANRGDAEAVGAPGPRPAPAAEPPGPSPAPRAARATSEPVGPPTLAALHGLALLQAVFPGRVVKIERPASGEDDVALDEAAIPGPVDGPEDDPDPGADAPLPHAP